MSDLVFTASGRATIMAPVNPSADLLLAQVGWIRELARHLVGDGDRADELVQETCVVALERPPRDASQIRRWLASVMRNLVRQRVRGDGRRLQREEERARPERTESADGAVERLAVHRVLVGAVMDLDEPYRTAIVLRYFDELPPREIANHLELPVDTVQRRLTRALATLRARLDGELGPDRRAWASLLVPSLAHPGPAALSTAPQVPLGGLLMNAKLVLGVVAVAVAGTVLVALRPWREPLAPPPLPEVASAAATDRHAEADRPSERPVVDVPGAAREELAPADTVPGTAAPAPAPDVAEPGPWIVRGRVLDAESQPVAGVALTAEEGAGETLCTSGAGGGFRFETDAEGGRLVVEGERFVTVRAGVFGREAPYEPVVIIAPAIDLSGRVVTEDGRPLGRALVTLNLPEGLEARFGAILDSTHERGWRVVTDPEGAFLMQRVPAVAGSDLRGILEGYSVTAVPAPSTDAAGIEIVLSRPRTPLAGSLRGRVVAPDGEPVPGARVGLGLTSALSDEGGEFALDLRRAVTADRLVAVKEGWRPAEMERPHEPVEDDTGWPDFVVLRLPGEALTISGRVFDHDGEALPRAKVWLQDQRLMGVIGMAPAPLEGLMAGARVPDMAIQSESQLPPEDGDSYWDWVFSASDDDPSMLWNWVETDASGRFEVVGLDDRHYRLNVMPRESIRIETTDPIRAGSQDVAVRLPRPDVYRELAGRVVDEDGAGVSGVRVSTWVPVTDVTSRVYGGTAKVMATRHGPSATTDAKGRFALEDVPCNLLQLSLASDEIVPRSFAPSELDSPGDLSIVVHVRYHLQVVLDPPVDRADGIAVATEDGEPLDVMILSQGSFNAYTDAPLVDGRSRVLSVSSRARRLLFLQGGDVVTTVPLSLRPGEVNVIRH